VRKKHGNKFTEENPSSARGLKKFPNLPMGSMPTTSRKNSTHFVWEKGI
jgi:hypothetical protein